MAVRLLSYDVSDLCLGKPPLRPLSAATATVADALSALKSSEDSHVSVWDCDHSHPTKTPSTSCLCVGKVCMVDVICYLCEAENLSSPAKALKAPVSVVLSKVPNVVKHVDPSASLLEAIDLILQGTENLVIPIKNNNNSRRKPNKSTSHNGREFCWLTQEDIIQFLLSSIGLFSPIPALSISSLNLISTDFLSVLYHSPPSSYTITAISQSLIDQTSVAVVDSDGSLVGEISPFTLSYCDETTSAALATLSAGDLMAYIDCGGPPDDLVKVVESRMKERNLEGFFESFSIPGDVSANMSSSEDESAMVRSTGRFSRSSSYSSRMMRRAEAIVCNRESSLVAVMIQAIAHRVNYVWVIEEEDCGLVGIVTFSSMLEVFYEHLDAMARDE